MSLQQDLDDIIKSVESCQECGFGQTMIWPWVKGQLKEKLLGYSTGKKVFAKVEGSLPAGSEPEGVRDDGGPAFPVECAYDGKGGITGSQTSAVSGWETGMSLRDYFAGRAWPVVLDKLNPPFDTPTKVEMAAVLCYAFADAMIEARKR